MSDAKGVKAGEAYVQLGLRDRFTQGLNAAAERFTAFGQHLQQFGGALSGIGQSVLAPIGDALGAAMDQAGKLADMSQMSGVATESLSALAFAAKTSGTDIDTLFKGMLGMSKFTEQVAGGSKGAAKALGELGVSTEAWLAATPEQRLALVADGLGNIADPSLRAAAAMKILGKSGAAMLPMLSGGSAGLKETAEEAERLGLVVRDTAGLEALGDAWDTLQMQFEAIAFQVGSALADTLVTILTAVSDATASVIAFVQNNQALVLGIAAAAAVAVGLGSALAVIGGAMALAVPVMAAIGTALAAIFSPLGLIVGGIAALTAGIVAGVTYWLLWTESGQAACKMIFDAIAQVKFIAEGLWAALSQGDWASMGEIGAAAFNVAWQAVLLGLKRTFGDWGLTVISVVQKVGNAVFRLVKEVMLGLSKLGEQMMQVPGMKTLGGGLYFGGAAAGIGVHSAQAASNRAFDSLKDQLEGASPEKVREALDKFNQELQDAIDKKAAADEERRRNAKDKFGQSFTGPGGLGGDTPEEKFGTLGTFSSSVAALLGRSAPGGLAERTAKATERTADAVEELLAQGGTQLAFS